ncbi:hypothetical protein ACTGW1_04160 [Streptococcus suis]
MGIILGIKKAYQRDIGRTHFQWDTSVNERVPPPPSLPQGMGLTTSDVGT